MWPECDCSVHAGFEGAAGSVEEDMLENLAQLVQKYPTATIKVTGHSLGGALANLTAMTILKNGYEVEMMLNFGQPRVGDKAYAAFSDAKIPNQWRMVNHKDIVPHLPPSEFPFSFYHTSTEVYEDKDGNYTVCQPGEDKNCSDQFWTYSISDHLTYMDQCMGSTCGQCPASSLHDLDVSSEYMAPHSDEFEPQNDLVLALVNEVYDLIQ